jgi:hypothetical protein
MNAPRLLVAVVGIYASLVPDAGAINPRKISGQTVILTPQQAPQLMKQCSRAGPEKVTGFWMPDSSDVALLEKELPAFVTKSGLRRPLSAYCRQYVGVISNGKKIIYINALLCSDFEDEDRDAHSLDWKREPIVVCDGGPDAWGVEFDMLGKEFQHFEANGAI